MRVPAARRSASAAGFATVSADERRAGRAIHRRVHLPAPGVEQHRDRRAAVPRCGARAACARAASVGTAATSRPLANARPFTVAMPTRRPVNEPGPTDTAKPPTASSRAPARASSVVDAGQEPLGGGARVLARPLVEDASPRRSATETALVAVSTARIR